MEEKKTIKLRCFFCFGTEFELPYEGYQPENGEQIRCSNCGRTNDYDSLMRVAKRKGKEWAEQEVKSKLDRFSKDLKRLFR